MQVFARTDRIARYRTALSINILVACAQIAVLVFFADSLSLFGDTSHSLVDIFILGCAVYVLRRGLRYPHLDEWRRGRFVWLAVIALWLSALYIVWEGVARIITPVYFSGWPVVLMATCSAIGNYCAHRIITSIERSEHDAMHKASVAHILTDLVLSVFVLMSGLGTLIFALPAIDAWLSLLVALWMLVRGWRVLREKEPHDHAH